MDSLVPVLTDSSVRTCCGLFSAGTEGLVSEVGLDVDSSVPVLRDSSVRSDLMWTLQCRY